MSRTYFDKKIAILISLKVIIRESQGLDISYDFFAEFAENRDPLTSINFLLAIFWCILFW
jgi:hypothetical protein